MAMGADTLSLKKMCYITETVYFLFVIVALPNGSGASSTVKKETPEQNVNDALPSVTCSSRHIRAMFGPLVRSDTLLVIGSSGASIPVPKAHEQCGVRQSRETNGSLSFFSKYDSCYAHVEGNTLSVSLEVMLTEGDQWYTVNISCPLKKKTQIVNDSPPTLPGKCNIQTSLRVSCGPPDVSNEACHKLGCCYHSQDSACYYRLNACSLDGHFVFSVEAADTGFPVAPGRLTVQDRPDCTPVITTEDVAVFKVRVTDCGTKSEVTGNVITYELEVVELQDKANATYSPFSLQVQCQYETPQNQNLSLLSPGPTSPSPVTALGTVRVDMRIATDDTFTSFYNGDELPLTLSLTKPVYVEVFIAQPSPDPSISLQMRDCFAYPASRNSMWTLLLDGCPDPHDSMGSSVQEDGLLATTSHSQNRRFEVKTFAFLDPETGLPTVEEMYFYCWVELCTEDMDCAQPCSIDSSIERQRRAVTLWAHQDQLVSWGPLLLNESSIIEEDNLDVSSHITGFQLLYIVLAVIFLLSAILITVWYRRRCRHLALDTLSKG